MKDDLTYDTALQSTIPETVAIDGVEVDVSNVYRGFYPTNGDASMIDKLIDVRSGIEDVDDSVSCFRLRGVLTDFVAGEINNSSELLVELCGSWVMPSSYTSGTSCNTRQYINPTANDAWIYSDTFTRCECGATVSNIDSVKNEKSHRVPAKTEHSSGCRRIWRWQSRLDLAESRQEVIKRGIRLNSDPDHLSRRLGYSHRFRRYEDYDVCRADERDIGKSYIAHTAAVNLPYRSPEEIGEAFGYTDTSIRNLISKYVSDEISLTNVSNYRNGLNDSACVVVES